jgi:adenine-specific DNA-methyltransferase
MAHEKLRPEYVFDEEKIAQLKQLAPECFEDGKINFTTLSQNLGDWRQDEEDPELEHFGLFWPGKRDARKAAAIPPEGTLEPVWGDGLKADGTPDTDGVNDSKNIFIEGENLEVLKLLQKSYAGKIKMIYIDPPYNTGNDFVYDDDFTEPLQEYLRRTGQVDEEGKTMTTNKRSDGRFHSKWLSMMYPRLRLARNLLREDGAIFISIDDNELNNLSLILNDIFGQENYLATFIIQSNPRGSQSIKSVALTHEYLLCFAKNYEFAPEMGIILDDKMLNEYSLKDENGNYRLLGLRQRGGAWRRIDRPSLYYPIYVNPIDNSISLEKNELHYIEVLPIQPSTSIDGSWRWSKRKFEDEKKLLISKTVQRDGSEVYDIFQKDYLSEDKKTKPKSIWVEKELNYQNGTTELKALFNNEEIFNFPKPVYLIDKIINLCDLSEDDIVLDFFGGSGTTAQAVIEYSVKKERINFILVQIPVISEYKDENIKFKNLAEACAERVRRVVRKNSLGFHYLALKNSNYKSWKNYKGTSISDLENELDLFNQSPLRKDFTLDGLLTEIILLEGFTLCSTISHLSDVQSNTIRKVTSEYCDHALLVCLDKEIAKTTVAGLQLGENDIFICLDSAISTEDKLRLSDKGLIKTI